MSPFRRRKRGWQDLSEGQRRGFGILAMVQFGLFLFALQDWIRRPSEEMRGGRKPLWFPVLFANFIGPITYLTWGRTR